MDAEKYKLMKKRLKEVLEENEVINDKLRKLSYKNQLLKKEKSLLLDRITSLDSLLMTSDSDATDSSKEEVKKKRKKRETKPKKIQDIPMVDGALQLPFSIGVITLVNPGTICLKPGFHNDRYIYPIGFQTVRQYLSTIDPNNVTEYTSTVLDGGDGPRFQIVAKDDAANKIRNKDHSNSASGPDYFGFTQPIITKLIQGLPNADQCTLYKFQKFDQPKEKRPRKKRQLSSEDLAVDSPKDPEVSDSQNKSEVVANQEKLIQKAEKALRLEKQKQERNAKKLEKEMAKKANLVPSSPFGSSDYQYQRQFMQEDRFASTPKTIPDQRQSEQQYIQSPAELQGHRPEQKLYKFINHQEWQPPAQNSYPGKPPMPERIPSQSDMYNQRGRNDQQFGFDPRKMEERISIDTRNLNNPPYNARMNKESPHTASPFQSDAMLAQGKEAAPQSFNSENSMNSLSDSMNTTHNFGRDLQPIANVNPQQFNRGGPMNRQYVPNSQSPTDFQLHMQMKQDPNMRYVDASRGLSMNEHTRTNSNSSRGMSLNERMPPQDQGRAMDPTRFSPHGMDANRSQPMMMDPKRNSPMSDRFSPMGMDNRNIDPRMLNSQMPIGNRSQMVDMNRIQMMDTMNRNQVLDPNRRNQVDPNMLNRNQMMETPGFGSDIRISAIESDLDNAMQLNSFPSTGNFNQIHQYQNK
ncbi:hypothetical protein HDV01_000710 [Terramyces sp. JEL0728]|nr:hypothetical protein HDV01_000710 [Terramyces sp. JEL0728]